MYVYRQYLLAIQLNQSCSCMCYNHKLFNSCKSVHIHSTLHHIITKNTRQWVFFQIKIDANNVNANSG